MESNTRLFYLLTKMLDIGTLIKDEMARQSKTVGWLAKQLNCDRTNIYSIYRRQSIDTNLLFRISQALHFDFFNLISKEYDRRLSQWTAEDGWGVLEEWRKSSKPTSD